MANNKVELAGGEVLIDLTADTVTAAALLSGYTAHDASGAAVTGTVTVRHYYTGSAAPTSALGADGDIYLQTGS